MSRKSGMEPERPAAPVLVIEDNTEVRQALVALLEAEGYRVAEAVDGVSALRLLRAGVSSGAHGGGSRLVQARGPRAIPRDDRAPLHAVVGRDAQAGYASEKRR